MSKVEDDLYISLKPSDAVHGGGMCPEGDYEITDARFGPWDYAGTQPTAVPALAVEFKNSDDVSFIQWYSAGDMRNLAPSEDGKRLKRVGSTTGLNDGSNCYQFLAALVRAGYPEDKLGKDISILIGMRVTVVHETTQEREIKGQVKKKGTIAVIGKILSYPGEKTATKTKIAAVPAQKGAAAAAAAAKANGEAPAASASPAAAIQQKAAQVLIGVLKAAPNQTVEKKTLTTSVFRAIPPSDQERAEVLNLIILDSFLGGLINDGILYDPAKGELSYIGG